VIEWWGRALESEAKTTRQGGGCSAEQETGDAKTHAQWRLSAGFRAKHMRNFILPYQSYRSSLASILASRDPQMHRWRRLKTDENGQCHRFQWMFPSVRMNTRAYRATLAPPSHRGKAHVSCGKARMFRIWKATSGKKAAFGRIRNDKCLRPSPSI